jgi:alanyl-tRNA synthetase
VLVAVLPEADAQALRLAASELVAAPGRVVALLGGSPPHALVVARSPDRTDVDAAALLRAVCAAHGGKGGGRPDLAQAGGVGASVDEIKAIVDAG